MTSGGQRRRKATGREQMLNTLIDLLYAAAVDETEWTPFLESLSHATDSNISFLQVHDPSDLSGAAPWMWGIDQESQSEYPQWAPLNPIIAAAAPITATGRLFRNSMVTSSVLWNSEFYNEYAQRYFRFRDTGGVCIVRERTIMAYLSQCRAPDRDDYSSDEWELWAAITPHLQRAIAIHRRLGAACLERDATTRALDSLSTAVFILDGRGRVLLHNHAARTILVAKDGLSLTREGHPQAARPGETSVLRRNIADACGLGARGTTGAGGAMAIGRPSGKHAYGVVVSPLRLRQFALLPTMPAAVMLVSDPEKTIDAPDRIVAIFGLTPAEARVAQLLAQGKHVSEIVDSLGVTTTTVRTHVRNALDKTGAKGQIDLVRLVAAVLHLSESTQ